MRQKYVLVSHYIQTIMYMNGLKNRLSIMSDIRAFNKRVVFRRLSHMDVIIMLDVIVIQLKMNKSRHFDQYQKLKTSNVNATRESVIAIPCR